MRARIILGSLLAVLVAAGFYFLVISPIVQNTQDIEAATEVETQREATLTAERNALLRVQEAELQYIDAVGELEASIPRTPNQSELINALEALATESAVVWNGATFGQPAAPGPETDYNEITLAVSVTGQYFELLGYLYGMQDLDRLIRLDSAAFSPAVEDNLVELTVTINATAFTTGNIAAPAVEVVPGEQDTGDGFEDADPPEGDDQTDTDDTSDDDTSAAPSNGG